MQLITKESQIKTRIDEPAQFQHSVGASSLIFYFNVRREIAGEELEKAVDSGMPLAVPVELISEALEVIYQKALELRAEQIAAGGNSTLLREPNYKGFYGDLLMTELFAVTRYKADENLHVNTAYTDFALALTNSIVKNENPIALQICLNKMLEVLGESLQPEQLETLDNLLEKHKIPISRNASQIQTGEVSVSPI